ncbi:MAG: hypothetical protein JRC77_04685, partial [Deltaproteobacteria bacterium]|nr:hypothetical protein [Deltaproteobacteria bacterium]
MACPHCGSTKVDEVECWTCGVVFSKVRGHQSEPPASSPEPTRSETDASSSKPGMNGLMACLLVFAGFAGFVALTLSLRNEPGQTAIAGDYSIDDGPSSSDPGMPPTINTSSKGSWGADLGTQISESHPPRSKLEEARNATLSIKTPWGSGSGFIIDNACNVVTNKHVVNVQPTNLKNYDAYEKRLREAERSLEQQEEEFERIT